MSKAASAPTSAPSGSYSWQRLRPRGTFLAEGAATGAPRGESIPCSRPTTNFSRTSSVVCFPAATSSPRPLLTSAPGPDRYVTRSPPSSVNDSRCSERLAREARQLGELQSSANPAQLAFELQALLVAANTSFILHGDAGAFAQARRAIRERLQAPAERGHTRCSARSARRRLAPRG